MVTFSFSESSRVCLFGRPNHITYFRLGFDGACSFLWLRGEFKVERRRPMGEGLRRLFVSRVMELDAGGVGDSGFGGGVDAVGDGA